MHLQSPANCNESVSGCNSKKGEVNSTEAVDEIMKQFQERCIAFNFLKLNTDQDDTIDIFKKMRDMNISKVHASSRNLNFDTVGKTVISSIAMQLRNTNQRLKESNVKKDPCSLLLHN